MVVAIAAIVGCDRAPVDPDRTSAAQSVESPEALEALRDSAERLLEADRPLEALALAAALAERAPTDWTALELHARTLAAAALAGEEMGAPSERIATLRRDSARSYGRAAEISHLDAAHAVPHLLRSAALMHEALGDEGAALEAYRAAETADPHDAQTPLFAAQAHLRADRIDEARTMIERALQLSPNEPFAWATLSEIQRLEGDEEAALRSIRTARRNDPTMTLLRVREARLLRLIGRPHDALTLLMALPPHERLEPDLVREIATAWTVVGQPRDAAQAWDLLARHDPDQWRWAVESSRAWLAAGDARRAAAALEPALRLASEQEIVRSQRDAIARQLVGDQE